MEITNPLTKTFMEKLLRFVDHGLVRGMGIQEPGKMCIEAAVNAALGREHSDNPPCVGSTFRAVKIKLNDQYWSSNEARAKGMRKIAVAQIGSNTLDQFLAMNKIVKLTIQRILPYALAQIKVQTAEIIAASEKCKIHGDRDAANYACEAANAEYAAANYAAAYAADSAAYAAANAAGANAEYAAANAANAAANAEYAANAANAANYAAYAADSAAYAAANAAVATAVAVIAATEYATNATDSAADAANHATTDANHDAIYAANYAASAANYAAANDDAARIIFADIILDVLIDMKSPGCEFLYLCEEQ